ncbi:MAG TPA: hypothetical protein PKC99_11190, partial [Anaerolineales bacterium]|nr:hypothetical protein [Anaerolineales bacterium]
STPSARTSLSAASSAGRLAWTSEIKAIFIAQIVHDSADFGLVPMYYESAICPTDLIKYEHDNLL